MKDATISELYDLTQTIAAKIFEGKTYPWEVLPLIKDFILELGETLDPRRKCLDRKRCRDRTDRFH